MIPSALKTYLSLATGLTEVTKARAVAAAKALVSSGEATVGQVGTLAEDLITTSRGNREALALLVRSEIDRALGRLGLATAEEVHQLTDRVKAAEARLREVDARTVSAAPRVAAPRVAAPRVPAPPKKTAARKAANAKSDGSRA